MSTGKMRNLPQIRNKRRPYESTDLPAGQVVTANDLFYPMRPGLQAMGKYSRAPT